MKRLSFWLGVLCILYASLYFLGLLPVSVWQYVLDLFVGREPNTFYKIVPSEGAEYEAIVTCLIGMVLIAFSKFHLRSRPGNE